MQQTGDLTARCNNLFPFTNTELTSTPKYPTYLNSCCVFVIFAMRIAQPQITSSIWKKNPCNSCHFADQIKAIQTKIISCLLSSPGKIRLCIQTRKQKLSLWQSRKQALLHKNNYLPVPRVSELTLSINLTQDVSSCASKSHKMFTKITTTELIQLHFLPGITLKCKMAILSFCACYMLADRVFEGSKAAPALHNHRIKQNQIYNLHGFRKSWARGGSKKKIITTLMMYQK